MPRVVHTKSCLTLSQYIFLSSTHTSLNPPPLRKPAEKTLYHAPKGWGAWLHWTKGPSEYELVPAMKSLAVKPNVEVLACWLVRRVLSVMKLEVGAGMWGLGPLLLSLWCRWDGSCP